MKEGDLVQVLYEDKSVVARILMISPNERSLIVSWLATDDGMLGRHAGMMPILRGEDGVYRALFDDVPVTLRAPQ